MSGFGYKGPDGTKTVVLDAEFAPENAVILPKGPPKNHGVKKRRSSTDISNRGKVLRAIRSTANNNLLKKMEIEKVKMAADDIASKELSRAELAGQLLAGSITPSPARSTIINSHPDFKKIETELILTRGSDIEGMCVRWKIQDKDGNLAVKELTKHFGSMRRRYSRLFDTLDAASREKMASSYMAKVDEIYQLAKTGHTQAMLQQRATDYGLITVPEYEAAAVMLEKMLSATNLIGAAMERQDKRDAEVAPTGGMSGPMQINGPVGRIQILGLPKAIKKEGDSTQKALPPIDS
jgi:hypothetical protein